ncbi:MFS transporter [Luteolibacter pohnpeiensis]|uniref:MFS transporter n=1 Tax=Luteolibacter pohnpeiensis TaxID=454153 RepID=A0A934VV76_9BACT|nr:MFS transporter [Luteolibacter pohnpeiensis]MBK1881254.1 MFS transporter [Luteolibacter pohnpeiensis]
MAWFRHQNEIDEPQLERGLKNLVYDGICSQAMGVLTGGAFLVAFALELGASNFVVGSFAAIMPLCQLLQIPAIFLVEKTGGRKALVVLPVILGRLVWMVIPILPWIVPPAWQVTALVLLLFWYFGVSSIAGCSYNSWMRDLIPEARYGIFFSHRFAVITLVGALLTLVASFGVEPLRAWTGSNIIPYSAMLGIGGLAGLIGVIFLGRVPEPPPPPQEKVSPFRMLAEPFKSKDFLRLLRFMGPWNFAINMAAAFFGVYMLRRLEMPISTVIFLAVASQLVNVFFFKIWGTIADRWSNRAALIVAGQLFFLSLLLWPFTTMPEKHAGTLPLLIIIHVLSGISTAGVNLCAGNLAMISAPRGKATSFLAANAVVAGIAATIGPLVGGYMADRMADVQVTIDLSYTAAVDKIVPKEIPAINLQGLDFVFLAAVIVGFYSIHRLAYVREVSKTEAPLRLPVLFNETRRAMAHVSNVAGLRKLTYFPFELLTRAKPGSRQNAGKSKHPGPQRPAGPQIPIGEFTPMPEPSTHESTQDHPEKSDHEPE